jgi:integrase
MARPPKPQPPKTHSRAWHEGTVKEVRAGVWRAWRSRAKDATGRSSRPSHTFAGPDAAQRAALWAKGDVGPAVLLLGDWLNRWLTLRKPTLAPNTYDHYRRDVLACAPLAGRPLADLTVDDWQQLTNDLLDRWARSHVAVWRGNISVALRAAMPDQLATNPLAKVKLPKPDEQPPKAWTQAEVDRLLAVSVGGTHEPWLVFSLGTGVRLGEARALRWADVDLAAKTATIRASLDNSKSTRGPTKTRRVRVIDLPDEVIKLLADHGKRQPPGQLLVFGHGARAYRARTYRSWLATRCTEAGVTPLPPHSLRHTYASLAFDALVPVQDVARQLGHTVETCQRTYAHFIGDGMRRAAKAIGKALRHRFSGPKRVPRAKIGTS